MEAGRKAIKFFYALWRLQWNLWLMYFCNLLRPLLMCFVNNWPYTSELQDMALLSIHTYVPMHRHTPDCICTHRPCKLHTIDISGPWLCKTGKAGRANRVKAKRKLFPFPTPYEFLATRVVFLGLPSVSLGQGFSEMWKYLGFPPWLIAPYTAGALVLVTGLHTLTLKFWREKLNQHRPTLFPPLSNSANAVLGHTFRLTTTLPPLQGQKS